MELIVARLLALGRFAERGVFAPEALAQRRGLFELILSELNLRGVKVRIDLKEVTTSA
jgi:hypothetical protein